MARLNVVSELKGTGGRFTSTIHVGYAAVPCVEAQHIVISFLHV